MHESNAPETYYEKQAINGVLHPAWLALAFSRSFLTNYERQILSFFRKELSHLLRADEAQDRVLKDFVQLRHAVRSGLTGVVGYVHEALQSYEVARRYAPALLSQARFRKSLVRANFAAKKTHMLLEESRYLLGQITRPALRLGSSSLGSLAREVVECLRPIADSRTIEIVFNNEIPRDQDRVVMDRQMIELMMFNVLDNAIKYSHRHRAVHVHLRLTKTHWLYEVSDDGIYVRDGDRASIFQPFVRRPSGPGADSRPGTGLGLAVSKSVIDAHNGQITVESTKYPDFARTTFTVRIKREQRQ